VADRRGGGADHLRGDLADQLPVKSVGGTGDAECRDDRTGVVSHRCGDRFEALLEFLDRAGVPIPSGLFRSPYPDAAFVFADRAVVIDHDAGCCYAMCWSPIPGDAHSARWLRLTGDLLTRLEPATASPVAAPITAQPDAVTMRHRCHPRRYRKLIGRCLDLIRAGETYDVCLTNTMTVEGTVDPVHAFRRMREINPAPFAALLEFDDASVISASPERFLRITADRTAESKPIREHDPAGARPTRTTRFAAVCSPAKKSVPRI
jgi:anthranilate/para-aminobenzoate synthase component I